MTQIESRFVQAAIRAAEEAGRPLAEIPLAAIAREAGVSRVTLHRRIGTRVALERAVRAAGVDPGDRPDVRERAVSAAAEIVRDKGFGALTLESIAARAACSVPALHSQLGGREGVIAALFERYSPLPAIEQSPALEGDGLRAAVEQIYTAAFDALTREPALARALLVEVTSRPDGPTARLIQQSYLPRLLSVLGGWLARAVAAGRCRPLPPSLLLPLLIGPIALHALTRDLLSGAAGLAPPAREAAIGGLVESFLRAVAAQPEV